MRSAHSHGSFLWNSNGERYVDVQRGLMNLHDLTGIPPLIKILDGEIKKTGELAIAGGPSSDIWCGIWLGQKRVRCTPYFYLICELDFHSSFFVSRSHSRRSELCNPPIQKLKKSVLFLFFFCFLKCSSC